MRLPPVVTRALAAGSNSATISLTHPTPAGCRSALRSITLPTGHTPVATRVKPGW